MEDVFENGNCPKQSMVVGDRGVNGQDVQGHVEEEFDQRNDIAIAQGKLFNSIDICAVFGVIDYI